MKKKEEKKERLIKNVTFLGFSEALKGEELYRQAFDVAAAVARRGYIVVNGGGPGVMRAATEGAHYVEGQAIGVTFYPKGETHFEGADPLNKVDELVIAKNYLERTLKLLEYGDIYILFNGGTGTISEFGMAWGLARLHFGHHKPLILFGHFWYHVIEEIARHMLLRDEDTLVYKIVTQVDQVVPAIEEFEKKLQEAKHEHPEPNPFRH